jgi:hypothetical protein
MRFGFSAIVIAIMLTACVDQRPPPVALSQPHERRSSCGDDTCRPPRSAALSSDMTAVLPIDSLPVMDVEQVCRGIAEQGGATFHDRDLARALHDPETVQTQKDCLDSEEHVRDQLAKAWGSFDSSDRRHCTNESKMGGESSYTELITCLEMARDVRKLHEEAKATHSAEMTRQQ